MLIVVNEPCREEHHHPDCPIVRQRKELDARIDEMLQEFKREVAQ